MSSILVNTSHIVDNKNNSTFVVPFNKAVNLSGKEIALTTANLYFSWRNITEANNKLSYTWVDGSVIDVILPIGFYESSDIYAYIQFVMISNHHYLIDGNGDFVFYVELITNNVKYSIDIITYPVPTSLPADFTIPANATWSLPSTTQNPVLKILEGMNKILGYDVDYTTDANVGVGSILQNYSSQPPNVNPNSSLILTCDQVDNEFSNRGFLYTIVPSVSIGGLIHIQIPSPIYASLKNGDFNSLTFRILTNDYQVVEIYDKEITLLFNIQDKEK